MLRLTIPESIGFGSALQITQCFDHLFRVSPDINWTGENIDSNCAALFSAGRFDVKSFAGGLSHRQHIEQEALKIVQPFASEQRGDLRHLTVGVVENDNPFWESSVSSDPLETFFNLMFFLETLMHLEQNPTSLVGVLHVDENPSPLFNIHVLYADSIHDQRYSLEAHLRAALQSEYVHFLQAREKESIQ